MIITPKKSNYKLSNIRIMFELELKWYIYIKTILSKKSVNIKRWLNFNLITEHIYLYFQTQKLLSVD
jgi:hypothetical protein